MDETTLLEMDEMEIEHQPILDIDQDDDIKL